LNDFNNNNEGPIAAYTEEVYNATLPCTVAADIEKCLFMKVRLFAYQEGLGRFVLGER